MRIFLIGISCVGKSTIGKIVADSLGISFFDLDDEIERFFGTSIERLQQRCLSMHSYRTEASKALTYLLNQPDSKKCVVAMPPSGLMGAYLKVLKKIDGITVTISDLPENILKRITFYDIDSQPIKKKLTPEQKRGYLEEIKKDMAYFGKRYQRAKVQVDICGLNPDQAALKIIEAIDPLTQNRRLKA